MRGSFRKRHISGQSLPDLVWWHGESFKGRHNSFCTMNTRAASFFCKAWPPTSGARRIRAPGRSEVSQIRTKRKMKHYPSGHESLFERTTPMKHCPVYIHLSASDDSDLATRTLGDADLQFGYRTPPALGELVIARRQLVAARAKRHG